MKFNYSSPEVKEARLSFHSIVCASGYGQTNPYSVIDDFEIGGGDGNTQIF